MEISFDMKTLDGKDVNAISRLIQLRTRELGETTETACVALAITIMKSLRAATALAKTSSKITVTPADGQYFPSWKKAGGKARRVLRAGRNGPEVLPDRVLWRTGPYQKDEEVHTYKVVDTVANDKTVEYLLVLNGTAAEARKFARERHKAYVMRNRGLAKFALGLAMHKVSSRESAPANGVSAAAVSTAQKTVTGYVRSTGFSSGTVDVHMEDNLDYAALALKGGEAVLADYVRKGLNSMTGYLAKRLDNATIEEALKLPYEELQK